MISRSLFLALLTLATLVSPVAPAAPGLTVLKGARVVSPDGQGGLTILGRGTVYLDGGRITQVGESLPVPEGARVVDLEGKWLLPGFIDAHYLVATHLGEVNEYSEAITREFSPSAAFDPWEQGFAGLLERGVTTVALSPGNQNVVGGEIELIRVRPGQVPLARISTPPAIKTALGYETTVSGELQRAPTSISGSVRMLRDWIVETFPVEKKNPSDLTRAPSTDGKLTAIEDGEEAAAAPAAVPTRLLVHVESRTQAARIVRTLRGRPLLPVLVHGREIQPDSWKLLKDYECVILGSKSFETSPRQLRVPAQLARQGVCFAFSSSGTREDVLTSAVLALNRGLSLEQTLASLTTHPAKIYGVEKSLGRIAPGHDADLVVWSDSPFSLRGRVEAVWSLGEKIYTAPALPTAKSAKPSKEKKS